MDKNNKISNYYHVNEDAVLTHYTMQNPYYMFHDRTESLQLQ